MFRLSTGRLDLCEDGRGSHLSLLPSVVAKLWYDADSSSRTECHGVGGRDDINSFAAGASLV